MHLWRTSAMLVIMLQCLLAASPAAKAAKYRLANKIPILVLTAAEHSKQPASQSRLLGFLNGLGIPYDQRTIADQAINPIEGYDLLIASPGFLSSSDARRRLSQQLKNALSKRVSIMYLGSSFCANADADLLKLFKINRKPSPCLTQARALHSQSLDLTRYGLKNRNLRLYDEEIVVSTDSSSQSIDVLVRETRQSEQNGNAILVGFDILSFWKHPDDSSAYLRPLLLSRLINRQLVNGYAAKHASMHGHQAPFLMRWEDVAPLTDSHLQHPLIANLVRLSSLIRKHQVPLNIAIVSQYVDPARRVQANWSDLSRSNQALREFIISQLSKRGASLIAHGYTHQYGNSPNDRSKLDAEMWDEATGRYLSRDQQRQRVFLAKTSIKRDWQLNPLIWETPHYQSNADTYQVVADEGFRFVVESDSSVFPNSYGYDSKLDPRLLNLPETAYEVPLDPVAIQNRLGLWHFAIQPDLYELGAPFLFFFHGQSNFQFDALSSLFSTLSQYRYWRPNLLEYAEFWLKRENTDHYLSHDPEQRRFSVTLNNVYVGHTIRFRLPDGYAPLSVAVDHVERAIISRQFDKTWYVYVPLDCASNKSITVSYRTDL